MVVSEIFSAASVTSVEDRVWIIHPPPMSQQRHPYPSNSPKSEVCHFILTLCRVSPGTTCFLNIDLWCQTWTYDARNNIRNPPKMAAFWNSGSVFRQYMVSAVSFAMSCAMAGLFPTDCRSVQTYPETGGLEMRGRLFRSHGSKHHRCLGDLFAKRRFFCMGVKR